MRSTTTCEFSLLDDAIIVCVTRPGAVEDLDCAKENVEVIAQLCTPKRRPMLADVSGLRSQDREARAWYSTHPLASAVGLVVGGPISRVIASFYLGINRPAVPTKVFDRREDAEVWLRQFVDA